MYKKWINPEFHAKFHLILTVVWIILIIPTILYWTSSIEWLVFMSLYAIITGHFSSYEATRAEIVTKKQIEGEFDDLRSDEKVEDFMDRRRKE
jgi:hypothetical protein